MVGFVFSSHPTFFILPSFHTAIIHFMKQRLKFFAHSIGFDEIGIAPPSPKTWEQFNDWLQNSHHGEMHYLQRRSLERKYPSRLLKNCRSVIVAAKRYLSVEPQYNAQPFQAIVSRYAWGDDYHEVVQTGVNKICRWIEEQSQGKHCARGCVDTAPILERDFAAQAGIGWFGKHTNLLSRSLGNWFFLGVVLTTLELEPDNSIQPRCGTCTRCLEVCPTNAFVSPYVLDARRCISYLTIELKGSIPRELRPLIGTRIFGCDDCLEVCPWNRFAIPTDEEAFHPRNHLKHADLIELMKLTDDEFRKKFKGSPIKRTKRRGLLRNAAVALGNTGNPRAIPTLSDALQDHEPLIREHAAWALGQIKNNQSEKALCATLDTEPKEIVREEIRLSLESFQNRR